MLEHLLTAFPGCAGSGWRPGAGFGAPAAGPDQLDAVLGAQPLDVVLLGVRELRLEVRAPRLEPRIVLPEVIACTAWDGEVVLTWSAPHTLVGALPDEGAAILAAPDGTPCVSLGAITVAEDEGGAVVLATCGPLFAVARGADTQTARARALAGVTSQPWQQAEIRLAEAYGQPVSEPREVL